MRFVVAVRHRGAISFAKRAILFEYFGESGIQRDHRFDRRRLCRGCDNVMRHRLIGRYDDVRRLIGNNTGARRA